MSIETESLSKDYSKALIRGERLVQAHAHIPEAGRNVVLFGKILSYDYRRSSGGAGINRRQHRSQNRTGPR